MAGSFRPDKKKAGDDTRARCLAGHPPGLRMNNLMLVPSVQVRKVGERQQRVFKQGWDPLFFGYFAYFHSSEIKINSWMNEAKKIRGLMPPRYDVHEVNKVLERAGFENKDLVIDVCQIKVEDGQLELIVEQRSIWHLTDWRNWS